MSDKKIPTAVLRAASYLVERYGRHFVYCGLLDGFEIWQFCFPETLTIGMPVMYRYKDGKASPLEAEEAEKLLTLLPYFED